MALLHLKCAFRAQHGPNSIPLDQHTGRLQWNKNAEKPGNAPSKGALAGDRDRDSAFAGVHQLLEGKRELTTTLNPRIGYIDKGYPTQLRDRLVSVFLG